MNRPTVLRNSAEPEIVIGIALKIFYNANDWVDNSYFLDRLDHEYDLIGKTRESRSGGQAVAKYKPALYYGLLDVSNDGKCRRINEYGKRYYEAYNNKDQDGMVDCLISSICKHEFGRNNPAVPESHSRIEPPNVFLVSCLLLNNTLSKTEYAYIIENLANDKDYKKIIVEISLARLQGYELKISEYAKNNYKDDKGLKFLSDAGFFDEERGFKSIKGKYVLKYSDVLSSLTIVTDEHNTNYQQNQDVPQILQESVISNYRTYITAIKSKPFLLLAGISGTGKSRIVRELARACWNETDAEYQAQKPRNFEMVQVKPNWHDSSELIGYVSRVSGESVYIAGDFLKFVVRAWNEPEVPYFLCLDEMNLAPVEQYFAEYLSVIESRKVGKDGGITTDPILKVHAQQWFYNLVNELTDTDEVRTRFLNDGICIPQNLIVVGTVNMDETTFSFSRKVLDRAMTIEMNEVDLYGGLTNHYEHIGKLPFEQLVGNAVEGVDVYEQNKEICDIAIDYLQKINSKLEGTPFKIAYRTRNEFLLYVVNNLPYNKNINDEELSSQFVVARALDEITNMKILSRIEGDETKVSARFLTELEDSVKDGLMAVCGDNFAIEESEDSHRSVSLAKLNEMKNRLVSGYTSFWS